jgi:GAF domain-containing protein
VNNQFDPIQSPKLVKTPIIPATGPEYAFSRQRWLDDFLKVILRASVVFAVILVAAAYATKTEPLLLIIYTITFIVLLFATLMKMPFRIRAGLYLSLLFAMGISSILENGIYGDSRTFFPVFIIMAAMLFGQRAAIIALILTILAGISLGIPILTGHLSLISTGVNSGTWDAWIMAYLVNTMLAILVTTGLRFLQTEYDRSQQSAAKYQDLLREERNGLELRVNERTESLQVITEETERRARQLETIAEVAHQISQVHEIDELFKAITQLISSHLAYYHVGIFIIDGKMEYAVLMAANSVGGQNMLKRGHRLKVGQVGIVGFVAEKGEPRISLDVGSDAVFFDNPDLPATHSEMALPLIFRNQIIGVLDVQSEKEAAFGQQDLEVMSILANQVAIAIENSRQISETSRALAEQQSAYAQQIHRAWQQSPLTARNPGYQYINAQLRPLPEYISRPEIFSAIANGQLFVQNGDYPALAIPLKIHDETIGILDITSTSLNKRWSENELALIQAITDRVALALENARLFEETTRRADREKAVSEITTRIRSTADPEIMLQTAMEELKRALGANNIQIRPYIPRGDVEDIEQKAQLKKRKSSTTA